MSLVKFIPLKNSAYKVEYENGVDMGELYKEIDGYYVYWPIDRKGFWSSVPMRIIADKLDELNADWDREVKEFFEKQEQESE